MIGRFATKSVFCAAGARLAGTLLHEAGLVTVAVGQVFCEASKAAWMIESHYGRRYAAATGVDLAEVLGEPAGSYDSAWPSEDDDS